LKYIDIFDLITIKRIIHNHNVKKKYYGALHLRLIFTKWFSTNISPLCGFHNQPSGMDSTNIPPLFGFQKVQSTGIFVEIGQK